MTSDRMMQAIGRIERAISRLETAVERNRDLAVGQARAIAQLADAIRETEQRNMELQAREQAREQEREHQQNGALALAEADPHAMNPFSHDKALAALRSLDSLIDDLQKARRDG